MRFIRPEYFDNFKCVASACARSCCVGWEIAIDEESEYRYLAQEFSGDSFITNSISKEEHCFLRDTQCRCLMLDEDGLCKMIKRYGEGMLCEICREHPRYYNLLPDRIEGGLGLCCITAGEAILAMKLPPVYLDGDTECDYEPKEDNRSAFVLSFRVWLEEGIVDGVPVEKIIERIANSAAFIDDFALDAEKEALSVGEAICRLKERVAQRRGYSIPVIPLCGLEPLPRHRDGWADFLSVAQSPSEGEYPSPLYRAAHRRLIFYFLHRYLCAVEQESLSPGLIMAVALPRLILDVALLRGADSISELATVASEFSESFEYSTENVALYLRRIEEKNEA